MSPRPLIFISAVSRELKSARQLVANTLTFLGYQPVWQDIFGTETGDLRGMLRQQIDQCKGVVQLVGQCYGVEGPTPDDEFGRVSYTQYEALYARKRGKKVWYLFIDESFPIDAHEPESEELRELQAAYRRRLQSDTHVFHPLTSSEALEASVLKLRDDLTRLRRGVKQWAVAVVALLLVLVAASVWLVQAQRRQTGVIQKQGEQVNAIVDRYQKMQQALVRLADVEAQSRQPGSKVSPEEQRANAYGVLERELGLPAGSLAKELPAFALELYNRSDTTPLMRARAAYALGRFDEAEKLSLEGAVQDRQGYESAQRVGEDRRKRAIDGYELAGQSAQKRIQYAEALEHFREAEKLTDRDRNPEDWAEVQYAIANVLLDQGQYSNAENILRSVVEVRTRVLGSEHLDTLKSRNRLSYALWRQAKYVEAETDSRELIGLEEKVLGPEHPETLFTRNGLANILFEQGRYAEAETAHRLILELREKVLGPEHPDTLGSRNNVGVQLYYQGKYAEAETHFRELIKIEQKVLGPEHPETLKSRSNLANVLDSRGKYAEAEAETRDRIKIEEKVLGPEHPDTLASHLNLVSVLIESDQNAEAEALCRKIIKIQEKVLGPEHPNTLETRDFLARTLYGQGKYAEAEAQYRELINTEEKVQGPEHSGTLWSRAGLARLFDGQGKYAEAEALCREIIKIELKVQGAVNPDTLEIRNDLARVLNDQDKYAEAEALCREIIKIQEKVMGSEHPNTLRSRSNLARALYGQGKYAEAEAEFRTVIKTKEKVEGPANGDVLDSSYFFASGLKRQNKLQEAKEFARRAVEGARKILGPNHPSTKKYEKLLADLEATK